MQKHRKVVQFIKTEYQKTQKIPSIREICKALGLSSKMLYEAFPGRKAEMCTAAGIPVNVDSCQQVARASQSRTEKRRKESLEGKELANLVQKGDEIVREIRQTRAIDEGKKRIRNLEMTLADTAKGRRQIFRDPRRLLEFAKNTIGCEDRGLDSPDVLARFISYCEEHNLEPASTL